MRRPSGFGSLTTWSLAALVAGCVLGTIGHATGSPAITGLAHALEPFGDLWITALRILVLPLVMFHAMVVIIGAGDGGEVGSLGVRAVFLFVAMLVVVGLFTLAVSSAMVDWFPGDATLAAGPDTPGVEAVLAPPPEAPSFVDWLLGVLPANPLTAALTGNVLPLLLIGMLVAFIVTRLPDRQRVPLARGIRAVAGRMFSLTGWMLWLLPLGTFVLILPIVLAAGGRVTGFLAQYVLVQCALVTIVILLLYPLTSALGRVSPRAFARAVAPAQLVAATTRSSIASLPALVQGGRDRLRLPSSSTGVVLPLAVAIFKLSRTVSAPLRLYVLAHIYHIPLNVTTVAIFLVTIILLSFGTVGLPSGVLPIPTLPAYIGAGIPIEGVVILEAVDAIPDMFKTVLNVTGDMSAAAILARSRAA